MNLPNGSQLRHLEMLDPKAEEKCSSCNQPGIARMRLDGTRYCVAHLRALAHEKVEAIRNAAKANA